jgi:MFS family permease
LSEAAATDEWRHYPMLPVAAALGYATSVIHIYGLSPYVKPLGTAFGWSRADVFSGLVVATFIQALMSIPVGMMVDRFGPRRLGVIGVLLSAAAFALFSTATGKPGNWLMLWVVMAIATLPIQATVWTSAVASRFEKSRGMAFALTLCGASLAGLVFPLLATLLIKTQGVKAAFAAQAGLWILIAFPLIFLFFRGARDAPKDGKEVGPAASDSKGGMSFLEGLTSPVYIRLLIASLLFTFTIVALSLNLIPILTDRGMSDLEAAGIASLAGMSSIVGRLGTGFLLDRFRASIVGSIIFLLPVAGCLVLIFSGTSAAGATLAAILTGLTLGAEIDVIAYLVTRHFGLKSFGKLYGGLLAALSIGTATGPWTAAKVFDTYGNYLPFLWLTIGFMIVSSVALFSLPRPEGGAPKA